MGSRDRKTKWFAEQLALDSADAYVPVISTPVTGNFVKQKADGTIEDAGVAESDFFNVDGTTPITGKYVILGDGGNGSWKIIANGSELIFQYKVSGTYEEVSKISYIP